MSSVDVIVPCYRYGRFLRECVESVLAQSGPAVRVLIIDDASPDNTFEVASELASEDKRVTVLRHAANKGHIDTYNEGIAWCSADYLLLLSADDYLLPGSLSRAADLMDAHIDVGFVFGKAVNLTPSSFVTDPLVSKAVNRTVAGADWTILSADKFCELLESVNSLNIVRTPTAVVRTVLQKRVGGYRKDLPHSGDLEMWLRLAAQATVGVIAANQAVSRFHKENMQSAYYGRGYLLDLEQRKAALDAIVTNHRNQLQRAAEWHRRLLRPLGYEAVQRAGDALGDGDHELARQLSSFAVAAHPGIRQTIPWVLLQCKEYIGPRLWRAMRTLFAPFKPLLRLSYRFLRQLEQRP